MKKLQLVTDGIVHGAEVRDADGNVLGVIGEVVVQERKPLTLVKIGDENFKPTPQDLEQWRQIFEQARADNDFTIFTHSNVNIEQIYPKGTVEIKTILD